MTFQEAAVAASNIQLFGAAGFGAIIGWYVYYINRHRKSDVQFSDLTTVIGIIGGGGIISLFPTGTDLFGAYGIGLFFGFFGYFTSLLILVNISPDFSASWFLDGRKNKINAETQVQSTAPPVMPGDIEKDDSD